MAEAVFYQEGKALNYTPVADSLAGEVVQLRDGRAGILPVDVDASVVGALQTEGVYTVVKTASMVFLDGQELYWDHSANKAHYKAVNDKDFFLGTCVGDAASAATTCKVNVNKHAEYLIDTSRDAVDSVLVLTAGTPLFLQQGGTQVLKFSATAEAQKIDVLSKAGFAPGANAIVEGVIEIVDNGDAAALDFNIGVANATHTSDADSITESCFIHIDGNTLDIYAESDDGTTEVAATDTTINFAEGTQFHFMMDLRNLADIQIYIDGALVLGSTTFKLDAATGPLKLLAHLEKSLDDTPGEVHVDLLRVRIAEQ